MIDWNKSAELNKCTIKELKAWFRRYPQSSKKVVVICEECGSARIVRFQSRSPMCNSCTQIGRTANEITRKKMSVSRMGHTVSPEARAKSRAKQSGVPKSDAARVNMSKAAKLRTGGGMTGKKHSIKAIVKMSDVKKGKKLPPRTTEYRQHQSAAQQGIPYDEWEAFACEKTYCPKFNEACRESNRAKYGYRCFICNKPQSENKTKTDKVRKLSVHHVDMDKAQGCKSNWKLVPLCMDCHATAHNDEMITRLGYMVKDS